MALVLVLFVCCCLFVVVVVDGDFFFVLLLWCSSSCLCGIRGKYVCLCVCVRFARFMNILFSFNRIFSFFFHFFHHKNRLPKHI